MNWSVDQSPELSIDQSQTNSLRYSDLTRSLYLRTLHNRRRFFRLFEEGRKRLFVAAVLYERYAAPFTFRGLFPATAPCECQLIPIAASEKRCHRASSGVVFSWSLKVGKVQCKRRSRRKSVELKRWPDRSARDV